MGTYRHCRSEPSVRFRVPHPFFMLLLVCWFCCGSCFAVDDQEDSLTLGYVLREDVSLVDVLLDDGIMLLRETYKVFGRTFGYDPDTELVTDISGLRQSYWNQFDIADKALAFVMLDMMAAAQLDIDAIPQQMVADLDSWQNTIRPADSIGAGLSVTGVRVPDLLATITQNQKSIWDLHNNQQAEYRQIQDYKVFYNLSLGDALGIITRNQLTTWEMELTYLRALNGVTDIGSNSHVGTVTLSDMLYIMSNNQYYMDQHMKLWLTVSDSGGSFLFQDGSVQETQSDMSITYLLRNGFSGLGNLMAGQSRVIAMQGTDPSDPLGEGGTYRWPSLFDYLGHMGETVERSLVKLQYVLASDQDIEMSQQEQGNKDAFLDNFLGDGEAAASSADIKDAAGLTSGAKDAFSGAGSASDAFTAIRDDTVYSFFSQEVANQLDTVGQAAIQSDEDWLSAYQQDVDGYYSLWDTSFFDVGKYLGGG